MIWDNLERRLTAIAIQANHADKKGVSTTAKSSYYRSAVVLTCTVIEGLVYELVKQRTVSDDNVVGNKVEHKELGRVQKHVFDTSDAVIFCLRCSKSIHIDDNGVDFATLNNYLKNKRIVTEDEYRMLDRVRKERNKIHVQGLETPDTGYTREKLEKMAQPLSVLIDKLS